MSRRPRWRLLVGTADGLHEFGVRERSHLNGHEVSALAGDDRGWWALVDGRTVGRSGDGGSWEEWAALPDGGGTCLALTPAGLLVGTAGAHLFRLEGRRLVEVEGFEQVEGRREWYTPWGDPPDTRSIAADPRARRAAVYRALLGRRVGFQRCTQGLPDWFGSNIDTFCLAASGRMAVFGTDEGTVYLSTDAGESWEPIAKGLPAIQCVSLA